MEFYEPRYSRTNLVRDGASQQEGEDYYDLRLSFRTSGSFQGTPGVQQFIFD